MRISESRRRRGAKFINLFFTCALLLGFCSPVCSARQTEEVQAAEAVQVPGGPAGIPATTTSPGPPQQADETDLENQQSADKPPEISDQFARLHLRDGSIIGGEIETRSINVETKFGMLTVPIGRIVKIYPGLQSSPELQQKISQLVEELGANEMSVRDKAQKEIASMGPRIVNVLRTFDDGGNAERKKRLTQILTGIEQQFEDETELEQESMLAFDDRIVTPDFSIIGIIQQKQFRVVSKFGDLSVKLGDLKLADREVRGNQSEVRKTIRVPAMAFFQREPKSTGIRVNKGDKISIRADGVVQWTNWNSSSTPDGLTNRSNWQNINSGKLVARIGTDNSNCVAIGSKGEFIAQSPGTLYLGIAMRDSYAANTSYRWSGEYKARIRVKPTND